MRQADRAFPGGTLRNGGQAEAVAVGGTLQTPDEIGRSPSLRSCGPPVYVRDVANVVQAPREDQARAWRYARTAQGWTNAPAVSLAIAKRKGANAVVVSQAVLKRVEALKGSLLPSEPDRLGHPRLRRDRQRQGQRTPAAPGAGHRDASSC